MQTIKSNLSAGGAERRKSQRIPLKQKVQFTMNTHASGITHFGGEISDISETGVYLMSPVVLKTGLRLKLFISLNISGIKKLFVLSGEVIRIDYDTLRKSIRGYGMRFDTQLDQETINYLKGFITYEITGEVKVKLPAPKKVRTPEQTHLIDAREVFKLFK